MKTFIASIVVLIGRPLLAVLIVSLTGTAVLSGEPCRDCTLAGVDWTTLPSTYTHRDGVRVDQFAEPTPPMTVANIQHTSVYRHHRSSLQGNNSVDHYHRVDEFGGAVRPYGEWRYPYRPYSVPYGAWGPALPQVYSNFGGIGPWFGGAGIGAGGAQGFLPGPSNALPAQQDELYPAAPPLPDQDRGFFYSPAF